MMKKGDWKRIFYQSLTAFMSLALAILLFFAIQSIGRIQSTFQWLMGILTPFIYGGVMAYLLKTPCNFLEKKIEALLPEKQKKRADALTVLLVLIATFFVIYLLLSMVIPEMVESIIILVNAVPQKIDAFADWLTGMLDGNAVAQSYVNTAFTGMEEQLQIWAKKELLPTM